MNAYWNPDTGEMYCIDLRCYAAREEAGAFEPISVEEMIDVKEGGSATCASCVAPLTPEPKYAC